MKYILGIDIGTGSTKAVAVDPGYKAFEVSQNHYPAYSLKPGYHEQDPEVIWKAFNDCLNNITEKISPEAKLVAIGLSSAMHSLIPVDNKCKPLSNMMTWADARSSDIAEQLLNSSSGKNIYQITGTPIHAMSPLCKIIWTRENDPTLFKKTHKFISIKEYIWYKLFNEFQVDHSIASATGLFDIEKLKWSNKALKVAGITKDQLSEPVSTSYSRSDLYTSPAFLHTTFKGVPFVIGASDGCLANLGSSAISPGNAAITIGTSGAVRIASPKPVSNFKTMTFSYRLDEETYVCGGPVNNGGIALQWLLKDFFGNKNLSKVDYTSLFEQVDATEPGCNGLIFLPYLTGERAPIWDTKSCGTFFGIRLHHTRDFFARAVLEGICYALNDVLLTLEQHSEKIKQVNVSGGFVLSKSWMQILADITGKSLSLVQTEDASAIGAAYMAIKAIGLSENYPSLKNIQETIIEPNPKNYEIYRSNFILYKQLYANLKDIMKGQGEGFKV
jgi:gluconokinase